MTESPTQPARAGFAHKAAAIALAVVTIIVALALFFIFRQDPAILAQCISTGSSACGGGSWRLAIPVLILVAGFSGVAKVWRSR